MIWIKKILQKNFCANAPPASAATGLDASEGFCTLCKHLQKFAKSQRIASANVLFNIMF